MRHLSIERMQGGDLLLIGRPDEPDHKWHFKRIRKKRSDPPATISASDHLVDYVGSVKVETGGSEGLFVVKTTSQAGEEASLLLFGSTWPHAMVAHHRELTRLRRLVLVKSTEKVLEFR